MATPSRKFVKSQPHNVEVSLEADLALCFVSSACPRTFAPVLVHLVQVGGRLAVVALKVPLPAHRTSAMLAGTPRATVDMPCVVDEFNAAANVLSRVSQPTKHVTDDRAEVAVGLGA